MDKPENKCGAKRNYVETPFRKACKTLLRRKRRADQTEKNDPKGRFFF